MVRIHNLGLPRIGKNRELKLALESFWREEISESGLQQATQDIRLSNLKAQKGLDYVPVGDFSLYDHVLDMSFTLGNIPDRIARLEGNEFDQYFRFARGKSPSDLTENTVFAGEMTKWFDTNYHYIVPEITEATQFKLNPKRLIQQTKEAQNIGLNPKPVIIGPISYLWLCKVKTEKNTTAGPFNTLSLLDDIVSTYSQLLTEFAQLDVEWVQFDEPILAMELPTEWKQAFEKTYNQLNPKQPNILLATYFGTLKENIRLTCSLPISGLHIDCVRAKEDIVNVLDWLPPHKILSLGVIDGRNIWKTDLNHTLDFLEPIAEKLQSRLWLAPSCSLLHVPVDLSKESELNPEVTNWLSFAIQKLEELKLIGKALNSGRQSIAKELAANQIAIDSRRLSPLIHKPDVQLATKELNSQHSKRISNFQTRAKLQSKILNLPLFPTTTIGSFPQTQEIRKTRQAFKRNEIDQPNYEQQMQQHIQFAIEQQEALDIDVLVHGEAERNDMVEFFGEQLEGFAFSKFGWVQSYGSRCVKPPILFGDIQRLRPMTVKWSQFAQSCTSKPMKGMLTGPVTLLNWSFVRDDQPRSETCKQLAVAVRAEVLDLEAAGIQIIQIDEAALREGLPLRQSEWRHYLEWAIDAFRISANGVKDETQIHTHMCYSEFNDIIESIAKLDADVITIETSRSDMELLDVFEEFEYPNDIGPGVYDIHSPNIPSTDQMVKLMSKANKRIPAERLWVNPDCGLKTRKWEEVIPALQNMVAAATQLRNQQSTDECSLKGETA